MKISKAIEILQDLLTDQVQFSPDQRKAAVELALQALMRHENRTTLTFAGMIAPLPDETRK